MIKKVVLNSEKLFNFIDLKEYCIEIIYASSEEMLFNVIKAGGIDAFIFEEYIPKFINFIKKKYSYIPIVVVSEVPLDNLNNVDIYIPYIKDKNFLQSVIVKNIQNYEKNFNVLKEFSISIKDKIEFKYFSYDPNLRILFYNDKEIRFTKKAGEIIEILSRNYGKLIKKEFILEKIWHKIDHYSNRSMDVYITNIRKIFKENNIDLKIKNISKTGLILE